VTQNEARVLFVKRGKKKKKRNRFQSKRCQQDYSVLRQKRKGGGDRRTKDEIYQRLPKAQEGKRSCKIQLDRAAASLEEKRVCFRKVEELKTNDYAKKREGGRVTDGRYKPRSKNKKKFGER